MVAPLVGEITGDAGDTEGKAGPARRRRSHERTPRPSQSRFQGLGWGFWLAGAVVVFWVLVAVLANVLPFQNPNSIHLNCLVTQLPSASHLLGCDTTERDILARTAYGSRVSLIVGFASIAMGLVVGGTLGLVAGYFRGWLDELLTILSNVFLSFPSLVLALVIVAYVGNSLFDITLIIAIVAWPLLFRVVRASTIEYTQREYVLAARALGSRPRRVLMTLLLPDVIPSAITYGLVGVAIAIVGEGALSFLGQSVPAPTATWGNMIAAGSVSMQTNLSLLLSPAIAMFSFILAINFMGDRLRGVLDVRQGVL